MTDSSNNTNRIARNSIFMAIRMVFVLALTLYTTRVVLRILGVEDYGIYNVVCGFVSMFAFLNTSMSNGIQRFYNYEYGKNGDFGATVVYNTALVIQALLAIIIIILTESLGLWYLYNKMVIPIERFKAALIIFQCSIINFLFLIMQAPYTAAVMAHERMDFYAIISIFDAIIKLGIVLLLPFFSYDKLVIYGVLYSSISILNFIVYFLYCKRNFPEIKIVRAVDKGMFSSMLSFSGWNVFGSLSGVMKEQGINLVLNLFFGPVVNAARGVANQVNSGLQSFVTNLTVPVRPQVIQSYAKGEIERTMRLTYSVSKLSCCCLLLVALPILVEIDYVLNIWLGNNIPEYSSYFIIIVTATSFLSNLNAAISGVVHASGKMKWYQIIGGSLGILSVPIAYIILRAGGHPASALWVVFIMMAIIQIVSLIILKTIVPFSILDYTKQVVYPLVLVILVSIWAPLALHYFLSEGFLRLIVVLMTSILVTATNIYFIGLNKSEKNIIKQFITNNNHSKK